MISCSSQVGNLLVAKTLIAKNKKESLASGCATRHLVEVIFVEYDGLLKSKTLPPPIKSIL